jgi:hypothetical protein
VRDAEIRCGAESPYGYPVSSLDGLQGNRSELARATGFGVGLV